MGNLRVAGSLPRDRPDVPWWLAALLGPALASCAPRTGLELTTADGWDLVPAPDDPWGPGPDCQPELLIEGSRVEVRTADCGWATLRQPLGSHLAPWEAIEAEIDHAPLDAAEPAVAHLGVTIDGAAAYAGEVAIPSPAGFLPWTWSAERRVPEGAVVLVHVDNHGQNAWGFGPLRVVGAE